MDVVRWQRTGPWNSLFKFRLQIIRNIAWKQACVSIWWDGSDSPDREGKWHVEVLLTRPCTLAGALCALCALCALDGMLPAGLVPAPGSCCWSSTCPLFRDWGFHRLYSAASARAAFSVAAAPDLDTDESKFLREKYLPCQERRNRWNLKKLKSFIDIALFQRVGAGNGRMKKSLCIIIEGVFNVVVRPVYT